MSQSLTHTHTQNIHSLTHPPACTYSRLWDDFPCCAGTWGKTSVGIQMAKNSPGASQQTQESAPCSAPTSLNAAPRIKPVVRQSRVLFDAPNSQGKAVFFPPHLQIWSRHILYFHYFMDPGVHMRPRNHTNCNHFVCVPLENCSPTGLWEGLTIMPNINEFWQLLGIVRSLWTLKDGVKRLGKAQDFLREQEILRAKDEDPGLSTQMQSFQVSLGICLLDNTALPFGI